MNEKQFLEELLQDNKDIMRLASPFQALPLKEKIIQYAYTSINIKFGNLAEKVVKDILVSYGAIYYNRRLKDKDIDQFFSYQNKTYFIEQKIRDDHDSSKKVGQVENYNEKKQMIKDLTNSACWFIDPSFKKNNNYYHKALGKELYYGKEINNFLITIFGKQAENFFQTFYNSLNEEKEKISKINFTFSSCIELQNISLSKLYELFLYGNKKEIIECFFAGKNPKEYILSYCLKQRKSPKVKLLMEMIANGELD